MTSNSQFVKTIVDQKRELLADSIRQFYTARRLPRDGLRNPFRLPGVMAVTFDRTRSSRRLERKLSVRFPEALASSLHEALMVDDLLTIFGENRHDSDKPGRDVMFFAMRKSLMPSFLCALVDYVERNPLVEASQWHTNMDRSTVSTLLKDMFDTETLKARKRGTLVWA